LHVTPLPLLHPFQTPRPLCFRTVSFNDSAPTLFRLPILNTTNAGTLLRVQTRLPMMWSHHGSTTPAMSGKQSMQMRKKLLVVSLQFSFDLTKQLPSPD